MPDIKPQLATLVPKPFDRAGWIFEPKWDGYRALAYKKDVTHLKSRTGKPFDKVYPLISKAVDSLPFAGEELTQHVVVQVDGLCVDGHFSAEQFLTVSAAYIIYLDAVSENGGW